MYHFYLGDMLMNTLQRAVRTIVRSAYYGLIGLAVVAVFSPFSHHWGSSAQAQIIRRYQPAPSYRYEPPYRPDVYRYEPPYRTNAYRYEPSYSTDAYRYDMYDDLGARDLGVRYLKLGNTYRETRNYDLAQLYVKKGLEMVRNRNSRYWEAVGYEYLGLVYRDMGERSLALEYLRTAESIFREILVPRTGERSDMALRQVIDDIEQARTPVPIMPEGIRTENDRLRSEAQRLQDINRQLSDRVAELEARIRRLEQDMTNRATPAPATAPVANIPQNFPDVSECRRDIEAIGRYRESILISNNYAPVNLETRGVRVSDINSRVMGTLVIGYLKKGESVKIEMDVAGGSYAIVTDGCLNKARDIDVRIINQRGVVLDKKDIRFTTSADITVADNRTPEQRAAATNDARITEERNPATTTQPTQATVATMSWMGDDPLRLRPSSNREPLAKLTWNAEYPGVHTFLVTMYDCEPEGAYFCFVIGKK